jgi:hypothetical protein
VIGQYSGALDDDGERLTLSDDIGRRLIDFTYDDTGLWPTEADGAGPTLVLRDPSAVPMTTAARRAYLEDGSHWRASTHDGGTPGAAPVAAATVVGRHVFYNNSAFDGNDPAANAADDGAVAPDKAPLLPGQPATFANYTSYSRGINGLMIDVAGLAGTPGVDDLAFRVGNNDDPDSWTPAPAPSQIAIRPGAGEEDSDRIVLTWDDRAIANQWLEVTVLPTEATGLAAADVFYFGNAIAESGSSPQDAKVNVTDMLLARNNPRNFLNPAAIDFAYDYNRDARVDATDMLLARNNPTSFLDALKLLTMPELEGGG